MPEPSLVKLPLPLRPPEKVVLALLLPMVRETAAGLTLLSVKLPEPCNPPKLALVKVPKLSEPAPLVSNVLAKIAAVLASSSVPLENSVVPVKALMAERASVFGPTLVKPPLPLKTP